MYKVTKCKPWIKDLQKHCDEMEKSGELLLVTLQTLQQLDLLLFDIKNRLI